MCMDDKRCANISPNLCSDATILGHTFRKSCPTLCRTPPCLDLPMCQNVTLSAELCELRSESSNLIKELCPVGCGGKFLSRSIFNKFTYFNL